MEKKGKVELTSAVVAGWVHDNVSTFVCAKQYQGQVVSLSVEQRRPYSTFSKSGEAKTLEPSDLGSAIAGLQQAQRCVRAGLKRCQIIGAWPHAFRPDDAQRVDLNELENHENLIGFGRDGDMRTMVFENATAGGLPTWKIDQFRVLNWGEREGKTRLLLPEHLADAIQGLATAQGFIRRTQAELWFDHSKKLMK